MNFFVYLLFVCCCCLAFLSTSSAGNSILVKNDASFGENFFRKIRNRRSANMDFAKQYLKKFGYMPPSSLTSEDGSAQLRSWKESLLQLQAFFSLPQTGIIDSDTLEIMHRPRCGNTDADAIQANLKRRKRYVKVGSKWRSNLITYSITNYTPKLGEELTHEAIDKAFAVWSKHSPLRFKKINFDENPDIVIFFAEGFHGDNSPFDGPGGYLAHAYYPGGGIGGDTHFDAAEQWTLYQKAYDGNDLFLVAVHEFGHALGLAHSADQDAVMAPTYRYRDPKNFQLPIDDINGIQSIYGEPSSEPEIPFIPTTKRTSPPPTTTRTTTTAISYPTRRPRPNPRPTTRSTTTTTKKVSTTTVSTQPPPPPQLCEIKRFDAVSYIRREFYVFSGEYMWRRQRGDEALQGPYKISAFWPEVSNGINAVYENIPEDKIVFFKDHLYWEYKGLTLMKPSPRHVRVLGLQNEHVGASMRWERNGKTYLFQGSFYWRLKGSRVERDYPKRIKAWKGIPKNIDAAFAETEETGSNFTYFVKGKKYWTFDNYNVEVVGKPRSFRRDWLGCGSIRKDPKPTKEIKIPKEEIEQAKVVSVSTPIVPIVIGCSVFALLLIALIIVLIIRRRRTENKFTTKIEASNLPYSPGFVDNAETKQSFSHEPRKMFVTNAEHKLRRFRFSLQDQV